MKSQMPFQVVQNLRATRLVLEAETKKAFDIMTRAEAEIGGSDWFNVWSNALVSLGVLLDHHIEPIQHITRPIGVTWKDRMIKRIPLILGKPD